jgi:hypothetical protein
VRLADDVQDGAVVPARDGEGTLDGGDAASSLAARSRVRRGWLIGLPAVAGLMVWMYALTVHANSTIVNSDGATVILQGQAVASGNPLLHGWILSLDSWWTLDVAFYAVVTAVTGVRAELLLIGPAAIAGLVVVVGSVIARRGRRGPAAVAGMTAVVAVLALPTHTLATNLMCGPIHVSTALYALVAFMGLRRNQIGWGWMMAVVLLAAGMLGDLQMASYGVLPVLVAGLAAMARRRSVRAGTSAVSAAICSVVLALVVRQVVVVLGGFSLGATNRAASAGQVLQNLTHVVPVLGQLIGVGNSPQGSGGVPAVLQAVHVVAAVLLVATLVTGAVRLIRGIRRGTAPTEPTGPVGAGESEPWRMDDLLVVATIGPAVNFIFLAASVSGYERYLTATVIFASVLAGRFVTLWWASDRRPALRRWGVAIGALSMGCFLAASAVQLSQPAPSTPDARLASFLQGHHLTSGVGDFWAASLTTVESDGTVAVRPVVPGPDGRLEAYNKGDDPGWFAGRSFQFVVYPDTSAPTSSTQVSLRTVTDTWGRPSGTYHVAGYVVLVWPHPIAVTTYQQRI